MEIEPIIEEITKRVNPYQEHNDTVREIEQIFRRNGFFTTREYPIYKIMDKSGRAGRIDLVARKGKFRVAIEYDHKYNVKFKSFQKIVQIKPDVAIGISGLGYLKSNIERASKYTSWGVQLYVVVLRQRVYNKLG